MADQTASENYERYRYALDRGHREYTRMATLCERMYLGGGRQWDADDLAILAEQRRPAYEFNGIMPSINAAIGHQIHNRMDIAYRPRGGNADQAKADIFSKVTMQIADQNRLHWRETEVFGDGIIQQRGFYDVRIDFDRNMQGNIKVAVPDPLDVIPDPDAKSYDPEGWADVICTGWLSADDIEAAHGKEKRLAVENAHSHDQDWGDDDDSGAPRNKFGSRPGGTLYDTSFLDGKVRRYRVLDRQQWVRTMSRCLYYPRSGDLKIAENLTPEVLAQQLAGGAISTKSMQQRVRWSVTTAEHELHKDWSPYDSFTIIPFFAYFRRGQTIGMIDNAIGPQQALNKAMSQFVHIVNTAANSGWVVEEGSLTNMRTTDLESRGATTGLVLEVKKGATAPAKIQPNAVPLGVDRLIDRASEALKDVTVPEAMRGITGPETAGIAIQSKQFAAQQQLAMPIDNLARTRHLLANKFTALIQQFYTEARTFRISEQDPATGKPKETVININTPNPATGEIENDLTAGDYDVVVTEQPQQTTFENSQFQQSLELRKAGIAIPDSVMVQHSSLSRKSEIVEQMQSQQKGDPLVEAKIELLQAQVKKTITESVNAAVEGIFSATQAANQIATVPQVAPLADALLRSAGFVDQDPAPIVPGVPPGVMGEALADNTHPLFPANPQVGMQAGMETPQGFANGGMVSPERYLQLKAQNAGAWSDYDQQREAANFQGGPEPTRPPDMPAPSAGRMGSVFKRFDADGLNYNNTLTPDPRVGHPLREFANGGRVQGPGTATSDSIPALVDGVRPIAVSAGEVILPVDTVEAVGIGKLNQLIRKTHKPA